VKYLRYLEGLRGLAALDVTLFHIWGHTLNSMPLTGHGALLRSWTGALLRGRVAVDVFIVLSGYLLMRPAARSADGRLPGGAWDYLRRRARRILPPYYAALLLALALELLIPGIRAPLSVQWSDSLPPFGVGTIVSHLLMVHNLSHDWAFKIDSPMWTVATEWQIYFLFPLLLLPVWRRLGSWASMGVGLAVGFLCCLFISGQSAAPWFVGLFAFGMAAAARERPETRQPDDRRLFGLLTAGLLVVYLMFGLSIHLKFLGQGITDRVQEIMDADWPMDLLVGATTACLLTFAAAPGERQSRVAKALSAPWLVQLGVVSYSLYLIHDPFFAIFKLLLNHLNVGVYAQLAAMTFIAFPLVLILTYGFHLAFEKPFMSWRRIRSSEAPETRSLSRLESATKIGTEKAIEIATATPVIGANANPGANRISTATATPTPALTPAGIR
jgi:peptidoglycan/LPS O-acetylase OafA/YrhL